MKDVFITTDFMLENDSARELFHKHAENLPIIDYHCHLSPKEIAENHRFENLTKIWLDGDHYKWRAMRTCGVNERFITGDASDWEKFQKWAETVPKTLRNPLYHWTHLELKRPFGIHDRLLNPKTAEGIWKECNEKLATPSFRTRGILAQMKAEVVCTTDDPIDDLRYHKQMAASTDSGVKMLPAFRADKAMAVENVANFRKYLDALSAAADVSIARFVDLLTALRKRHDYFHQNGCRLSDHGLETAYAEDYAHAEIEASFGRLLTGQTLGTDETRKFKSAVLFELAVMDSEKGWVQQFHLGALRNNNLRMMRTIGPDTGYDSIGDFEIAKPLAKLLGRLDDAGKLAKTILYNLNPRDNELMATMIANFQDGSTPGKLQYGAAWWFLDQKDGMTQQIEALSNMGLLSQFIGMLTDSRSFLSFPRHEYFRRILCNILGDEMERGLIPKDTRLVGEMVANICYGNAKRYFNFDEALRNN